MQVNEVTAEGLKREYRVVIGADEIASKVDAKVAEISKTMRMPGFRPGKVPAALVKKQHGPRVLGEVLEQAVNETSQATLEEKDLKPALRPKIEVVSFEEGKDLEYKMEFEVLPDVPPLALDAIEIERPTATAPDEQVEESLNRFADTQKTFDKVERPAESGDQVVLDFIGEIDGVAFEGGSAEDFPLELDGGRFIPGFEDQLIGVSAGDARDVEVSFPEDYGKADLAGKPAVFKVTVKEVRAAVPVEIDDALAEKFGLENLEKLRQSFRERMQQEYDSISRLRAKRALLDHFADTYKFDVPAGMVDLEFETIWKQLNQELERTNTSFEDEGKSEDEVRSEYRDIAERRVRLGLILSEIGNRNEIKVEANELNAAIMEQARRYPGQQKEVFEFFQKNPAAVEQLRAPIFEDKVVDFVLQLAKVTNKPMTPEELMRDPDEADSDTPADTSKPSAAADAADDDDASAKQEA
ncbi:MAG: trigger factor [Geminicoccaceae bacterium]